MSKMTKDEKEQYGKDWYELTHKNWRAWGSWFSWGSPVGLGLFLYLTRRDRLDTHPGVLRKIPRPRSLIDPRKRGIFLLA